MRFQWQPVLGCLCVTLGVVLSAAVPTPDTMVVARSENAPQSTPALGEGELSTEGPVPPIKLTEMTVTSDVALRYAHTAVTATVRNPAARAQQATFRLLLPETAFISSFTMILDGKPYRAYVKEKEEAKQIYDQAVSQGLGAAHVETKARDSNHFTVSVNVEPHTVGVFNLTYEELLVRRGGVYNHAVNLHPGALVPSLSVTVRVRETQPLTALRVPEVRTGNEIDATAEDAQNSLATIERAENGREAVITFKPDLAEQQRLIDIYLEKTKETRTSSYSYYDNYEDKSKEREAALGQFVVQYDVERPKNGEILVNDGYFVHFYAPSDLPPLNKHCVFVLDTSGSMMDRKIVQLREAMQTILGELNSGDYFSIVEFASSVKVHELKEADQEPSPSPMSYYNSFSYSEHSAPAKLVPPSEATPENIAKAKVIVSRLQAAGGTNIYSALDVAVELIRKGVGWTAPAKTNSTSTTAAPDVTAAPTAEPLPEAAAAEAAPSETREEEVPQLEPIIIFLTDGDPTVGETDPTRIINHLTEKNSGMKKATIFSLAFGEDADRKFLRKLSLRNDGFMRHIYEAADAALQLRDFYRQVASPLLADVKFVYPKKQVKADSLTKHRFRRYYSGSEAVVAGRVEPDAAELTPTVGAFCGVGDHGRKYLEILPKAPVPVAKDKYLPLERLWAYLTVRQLLDERDARDPPADDADDKPSPDKKALDIALKYSFVTPLTSLVVVKPNATDAVDAESVYKQNQAYGFNSVFRSGFPVRVHAALQPLQSNFARPAGGALYALAAPQAFNPTRPQYQYHTIASSALFSSMSSPMHAPAVALDAVDFEEEEEPEEEAHFETSTIRNPLEAYHLKELDWLKTLLAGGGSIEVPSNTTATKTVLKLSESDVAPRNDGADEECAQAVGGAGAGACVYLTRCAAARDLTAASYPTYYCSVGVDRYAGVCCPKDKVDVKKKN